MTEDPAHFDARADTLLAHMPKAVGSPDRALDRLATRRFVAYCAALLVVCGGALCIFGPLLRRFLGID